MQRIIRFGLVVSVVILPALLFAQQPPVAKVEPTTVTLHGDIRVDNYAWMKKKNSGAMKKYLKAENAYTEAVMSDTKALQEKIYKELIGRLKETDMSVPYKYKDYWYYTKTSEGANYWVNCRKKDSLENVEEVLLDVNQVVKQEKCYIAYMTEVSPDNNIMVYAVDKTGSFEPTYFFKDLKHRTKLPDALDRVSSVAWSTDNRTVFYTVMDKTTNRSYRLYKHTLGTSAEADILLYEEKDPLYDVYVWLSKSEKYIFVESASSDETEYRFLPADQPDAPLKLLYPREKGHEYFVDHYGSKFYITTNKEAINFKAVSVDIADPSMENWQLLIPHRDDVLLDGIDIFDNYLVISERVDANDKIRIRSWSSGEEYFLPFEENAYSLSVAYNPDFSTEWLRFSYSSLKTPSSLYEINMGTKEKKLLKQKEIPDGHNPDDYVTEKVWAAADDGKKIPISLLYKKEIIKNGSNPVYLESYGSYGSGMYAYFNNSIYPLVDRGFIYAIAHIRGGDDLGRKWYYDGKMLNKKNTFQDFIACTEHLVKEHYTSAGLVVAQGESAGGLLMGAVANMRPDLYRGIILHAPFVDVLNTMMDTLLPLTTGEFIEWGNPYEKQYYDYIKSYSPYDNVKKQDYPNLLFTSGISDEQVGVWEPAKMVAKLRAMKTDQHLLLLKVTFKGGHGGVSGRYEKYKDLAFEYAWVLKMLGKTD